MPDQSPDLTLDKQGSGTDPLIGSADALEHTVETLEPEVRTKPKRGPMFWFAFGWLGLVVLLALLAPVLPLRDPDVGVRFDRTSGELCPEGSTTGCSTLAFEPPFQTTELPLGTNALGRDMLARTIYGARISMLVGFAAIVFGVAFGGTVGLLAGYFKGRVDTVLMGLMDIMLAFPPLVLALAIVTFSQSQSVQTVVLALGIVAIPSIARLTRANTIVHTEREFVLAARTLGASNLRIIVREVLPNVVPAVVSFSLLGVAVAIVAEGLLSFLGLSVSEVTWGSMIYEGRPDFEREPAVVMIPCVALWITVMALNLASDQLRQLFDVKESAL